jgi:hypothetical protein
MSGSGKDGNNWGRPSRRRGRDADSRRFQPQESGKSSLSAEKPAGRSLGTKQGAHNAKESRRGSSNEGGWENPSNLSSRKRLDKLSGFLFRGPEKDSSAYDRPKWTAPPLSTEPIPHPLCPYCGKPIKDIAAAMTDKATGQPVHFDCAAARIAEEETLESGDAVVYIGGGRFGIVHFPGMIRGSLQGRRNGDDYDTRDFRIKKILEWENKENRALWRKDIEDHFSVV